MRKSANEIYAFIAERMRIAIECNYKLETYVCVDKFQFEADAHHADWREIQATTRNHAKVYYSLLAGTNYTDVKCCLKKNFVKL